MRAAGAALARFLHPAKPSSSFSSVSYIPLRTLNQQVETEEMPHREKQVQSTDPEKIGDSSSYNDNASAVRDNGAIKQNPMDDPQLRKKQRKLVMKLDVVIIPIAMLLYLSAYLDRGALGNARLLGLETEVLNDSDTNYSVALCCFYITYIVLAIPGVLAAKAFNPSYVIAAGALIWSVAASSQAGAHGPAGIFVARLFVGVGEAFFGQPIMFLFSLWYTKNEIAKRVGLFITSGSLAGAFSGLISYGVAHIDNPAISKWRVLFLLEGLPGVVLAIIAFFFLPSRPETSKYINEEERELACARTGNVYANGSGSRLDMKAVKHAFLDPKTYIFSICYSCINLQLGSVSGFLPTIIKNLGYTNAEAQLFSVPPYAVTVVFMLLLTTYSDRVQTRGIPIACVFAIGTVGWGMLYGIDAIHGNQRARYFACICVVASAYSAIPLVISWTAAAAPNESQRAVALGMLNSVGQCLAILAAFLFPKVEGPRYVKGNWVNLAFALMGMGIALGLTTYFRLENKRRNREEGVEAEKPQQMDFEDRYDKSKYFRYVV